mmetsp:Transcript_183653/g.447094  ORF Transcript_183653/g.447094 Transcript_183653/m.447094 type:complete len:217 (-) Transcript_183653:9-659(-)
MRMQSFTPSRLGSPSPGCCGTLLRSISSAGMGSSQSQRCGTWLIRRGENFVLKWLLREESFTLWSRSAWFHSSISMGCTKITSLEGSSAPPSASSLWYACLMVGITPSPRHQRSMTSEMTRSNFSWTSSPTCRRVDIMGGRSCTRPFLSVMALAFTATTSRHICRIWPTASQSQTSAPSSAADMPRSPRPQPASRTRGRRPSRARASRTAARMASP